MQKIRLLVVMVMSVFIVGCATMAPVGMLYTKVNVPLQLGDGKDISYSKVGQASANSYFSLIATGDASVEAAAKNGNIKTIKYVDYHVENILGFIGTYTTTVYGD